MKENRAVDDHPQRLSKQRIFDDLRAIGVKEGDHLAVVLSLKSIGYIVGGPKAFIRALLEAVGPRGTIMMNTHTRGFPLSEVASDYTYNRKSTPCWTGVVPETFRKWQNAVRSKNPITSIAAIGRFAEYLAEGNDEHSSLYEPYSRLASIGGKYLCVGLGDNLVAIRHEAQHLAGFSDVVKIFYGVRYINDDRKIKLYVFNHPPCFLNLPSLVPLLKVRGLLRQGKIGSATAYLASTRELLNSMKNMLEADPTLNLCDKLSCLWCRETERKLALHSRIKNGKYFQKSPLAITFVHFINSFRLRRFLFLSFRCRNRSLESRFQPSFRRIFVSFLMLCYLAVADLLK